MKNLLKPNQVAEIFGTSQSLVYQLAKDRKIRSVKLGDGKKSSIRFRMQDVEEYINNCIKEPLNGYNFLVQTRQRPRKGGKKNGAVST
jgi:excisionase family DNA binding protein